MATVQTMHYTLIIVIYTPELVQKYHIYHSQTPLEKERKLNFPFYMLHPLQLNSVSELNPVAVYFYC